MPSPFPGMDPFLEGWLWTTVHGQLSAEIVRQLAPKLRPRYLALMERRFVIAVADEVSIATTDIYPDVGVRDTGTAPSTGSAEAVAIAPLRMATIIPTPVPHYTVEIRDRAERRLVTAIEMLSPTNKRGEGRNEYLTKRHRLLLSTTHVLELDLLREGQRVPMVQPLPSAPYFVFVSRIENRPILEYWPITLQDRLPVVPVPLLPSDPDVPLDLQLALTNVYDLCGYDLAVDYTGPPEVPLPPEADAWADERLRAAGLRS